MRRMLGIGLVLLLAAGGLLGQDSSAVRPSRREFLALHIGGFYPSAFHNRFAAGVAVQPFARVPLGVTAGVMTQRARSLSQDAAYPDISLLATYYRSRGIYLGARCYPFYKSTLIPIRGLYAEAQFGRQFERVDEVHIEAVADPGTTVYADTKFGWWIVVGEAIPIGRRFHFGASLICSGNRLIARAPVSHLLSGEINMGVRL